MVSYTGAGLSAPQLLPPESSAHGPLGPEFEKAMLGPLHFWPARVHDGALLAKDVLPDVLGPVRADRRQQQDLDLDEPTHEGAVVGLCGAWPGYPHAGSELAAQCGGTREEGRTRPDLMQMSR